MSRAARAFHIPGIVFLFFAFVLLFLVSISLPYLTAIDFVRVHAQTGGSLGTSTDANAIDELRFGSWASCSYAVNGGRTCLPAGHGYSTKLGDQSGNIITIGPSWTRGLAIHPVCAGVTLIAFGLSLSTHLTLRLCASLVSFLAATLTLIAFAIDIALYAYVKHQMGKLSGAKLDTDTAPAFWMTFVSLILLLLAGTTVCFGRRKDKMDGATSYPMSSTKKSWVGGLFKKN
ncbi:hypothetical protein NLI96_g7888 [Meripilus lineatus]|uniref:Pali-domain-containing protein n=1 Tax=Meripilus lineatus TaxID=2056292 RepID=A0AAD5YBL8_9APHY|nr:hypothetical protein NLI96_g7888 [Physisporinus lineatus]